MATVAAHRRHQTGRYFALVRAFPLKPIRSERQLDRAIRIADALLDRGPLTNDQRDYVEVLGGLIEQYEESRHPIRAASDAELLAHLLEARGITQADVAREAGIAESTVSAVLKRSRKLTREQIGRLSRYFHVSPAAFAFDVRRA